LPSGAHIGVRGHLHASIGHGNGCLHYGVNRRGGHSLGAEVSIGGDGECHLDVNVHSGDGISLGLSLLEENHTPKECMHVGRHQ